MVSSKWNRFADCLPAQLVLTALSTSLDFYTGTEPTAEVYLHAPKHFNLFLDVDRFISVSPHQCPLFYLFWCAKCSCSILRSISTKRFWRQQKMYQKGISCEKNNRQNWMSPPLERLRVAQTFPQQIIFMLWQFLTPRIFAFMKSIYYGLYEGHSALLSSK